MKKFRFAFALLVGYLYSFSGFSQQERATSETVTAVSDTLQTLVFEDHFLLLCVEARGPGAGSGGGSA